MACGEDSTYTATPALLELLPHGKRGEIAKAAGIGGRYHAERTQRRKCEQEHGGKGFPGRWASAFQSVHRAHQRGRQAQRKHSAALSPDVVQRIHKGGTVGACAGKPLQAGRSTQSRRDRRAGPRRIGRCPAIASLAGCANTIQCHYTACLVYGRTARRDLRPALV